MLRFLISLLLATIAGCAAPWPRQMYDGAPLPQEKIAVIQLPAKEFSTDNHSAIDVVLDSRQVRDEKGRWPSEIHVLPGVIALTVMNDLDLCCSNSRGMAGFWADVIVDVAINQAVRRRSAQELTLTAQAGRTYALRYALRRPSLFRFWSEWKIDYWIEDMTDNRTVAGAKP